MYINVCLNPKWSICATKVHYTSEDCNVCHTQWHTLLIFTCSNTNDISLFKYRIFFILVWQFHVHVWKDTNKIHELELTVDLNSVPQLFMFIIILLSKIMKMSFQNTCKVCSCSKNDTKWVSHESQSKFANAMMLVIKRVRVTDLYTLEKIFAHAPIDSFDSSSCACQSDMENVSTYDCAQLKFKMHVRSHVRNMFQRWRRTRTEAVCSVIRENRHWKNTAGPRFELA